MPPHPLRPHPPAADPSEPADHTAAARALLATTVRDPWRASLLARRLPALRERLGELGAWLASLPRRLRRAGARYTVTDAPGVGGFAYRLVVVEAEGPPAMQGPVSAIVRALRAFLPFGWRR